MFLYRTEREKMQMIVEEKLNQLKKVDKERLALKIKAYRREYGYTQETLSKRLGIKRFTLHRWESAKVKISHAMLRMLIQEGVF